MDGPVHIPTKRERDEQLKMAKAKKGGVKKKKELNAFLPLAQLKAMTENMKAATVDEVPVSDLSFSFEKTPLKEGWFQTYHRQDQGDEFLFFPETNGFPLPYEMPVTTFYPRKDKEAGKEGGKKGKNGSNATSGTATPCGAEESASDLALAAAAAAAAGRSSQRLRGAASTSAAADDVAPSHSLRSRNDVKRDLMNDKATSSTSGLLARLCPKAAASLAEFSRKSPRCHASTKALLHPGPHEDGEEDGFLEDLEPYSRTSSFSKSPKKKFQNETVSDLISLAESLDTVLREEDPVLAADAAANVDQDIESGGGSGRHHHHHKKKKRRRSSGASSRHSNSGKGATVEDPMDRIVASNVDAVLLDCLEDELPSVTLDEDVPGSDVMDLLRDYENCNSVVLGRRWLRPNTELSRQSSSNDLSSNGSKPQTLTAPVPITKEELDVGSSSDFSGYSSSAAGSLSGRKKRKLKRNLTGFPSIKKKKKPDACTPLLNNVLQNNQQKQNEKRKAAQTDATEEEDDDDDDADESNASADEAVAATASKPSSVKRRRRPVHRKSPLQEKKGRRAVTAVAEASEDEDEDDEEEDEEGEEEEVVKPASKRRAALAAAAKSAVPAKKKTRASNRTRLR